VIPVLLLFVVLTLVLIFEYAALRWGADSRDSYRRLSHR
jgi:hypothetical protein